MQPLIFELSIYALVFWIVYLAWCIIEILGSAHQKADTTMLKQDRGSVGFLIGAFYAETFFNFASHRVFPEADIIWNRLLLFWLSIALMLAGIILRQRAVATLGRSFTREVAIHPNHSIIQSGPYRFIRHPAYCGTMVTTLGFCLAMTNWVSLLLTMTCFFASHFYRIVVEERALCASLGQAYVEYMKHTRRLIPFLF